MIRPVTIATFLMACSSGLYLYQSKHEVQVLDNTIEHEVHETAATREQSRALATQWAMLNDPERLRKFSERYLALKTIDPKQFTSLADLDNRLPPVRVPNATPLPADSEPANSGPTDSGPTAGSNNTTDVAAADDDSSDSTANVALPVPPAAVAPPGGPSLARPSLIVKASPTVAPATALAGASQGGTMPAAVVVADRPVDRKPMAPRAAEMSRPTDTHVADVRPVNDARQARPVAEARSQEMRITDTKPPVARFAVPVAARGVAAAPIPAIALQPQRATALPAQRPVTPPPQRIMATATVPVQRAAPAAVTRAPSNGGYQGGSLLGMARSVPPPAPMPTRVSATYNAN
jgi:hypothetical protein